MQVGVLHLREDEAGQRNRKQESLENVGRGIAAVEQIQSPFSFAEQNTGAGFYGSPHSWSLLRSLAVWKTFNSGPGILRREVSVISLQSLTFCPKAIVSQPFPYRLMGVWSAYQLRPCNSAVDAFWKFI